eukprot:4808382-Pyramimonas_sp.AAC.1
MTAAQRGSTAAQKARTPGPNWRHFEEEGGRLTRHSSEANVQAQTHQEPVVLEVRAQQRATAGGLQIG